MVVELAAIFRHLAKSQQPIANSLFFSVPLPPKTSLVRNVQIVFDLRRYLPGGWYLPAAHVVEKDKDGILTYLLQSATPGTIGSYGLEETPLLRQLFALIESLSEKALEAKFNPPKGKPKPLDELLQNPEIKPIAERYVHRQMDVFLKKMTEHRLPLTFMAEKKALIKDLLLAYPEAEIKPHLIFRRTKDKIIYRLNFTTGEERWLVRWKKDLVVLTNHPGWLLVDGTLYPLPGGLNGNMVKPFMTKDEQPVPNHMVKEYFQKFIMKAVERAEVEAEGFELTSTRKMEGCELSLSKHLFQNEWLTSVKFQYLGTAFSQNDSREMRTALHFDEAGEIRIMQVRRQREVEQSYLERLSALGFSPTDGSLWKLPENSVGASLADARASHADAPFFAAAEWLATHRAELEAEGFTLEMPVFEEKNICLSPASWSQDIRAAGDWFDLRITVRVGEFEFPFSRLAGHIRDGNRLYELPDGTFFLIPSEWMNRFHSLVHLGKMDGDAFRVSKSQRPLLDALDVKKDSPVSEKKPLEFVVPPLLNATLRPYQLEGAAWLSQHYAEGLGACLADDMGLGKTLQTLAVLLQAKQTNAEYGMRNAELAGGDGAANSAFPIPHSAFEGDSAFGQASLFDEFAPLQALIILPASLVFNWEREVKKFAPLVQVCKHVGSGRTKDERILRRFDLVLTTYQTARLDLALFNKIEWECVVLDESQYVKNPDGEVFKAVGQLRTRHKISLSGTPIENSLKDLWAQMQFLNPDMLGSLPYFKKHFIQPIEKQGNEARKDELRHLVSPYLLRRTKEQVAPELPELSEEVFLSEMTDSQRKLYEREKSAVRNQLLNIGDLSTQRIQVLAALMRLRQIANHPALLNTELGNAEYGMGENSEFRIPNSEFEGDSEFRIPHSAFESGKFSDVLEYWETIRKAGHKALIFSSFEKHLRLFRAHFEKEKQSFAWLTGEVSAPQRKVEVDKFQNDPSVQAFFMTTKAGGVGLNLTAADYVLLLDPWWNPAVEAQAIARAHRIGQEKKVLALRFIARDTIEEKILQLQERKSKLAGEFFGAPEMVAGTREGLAYLLE